MSFVFKCIKQDFFIAVFLSAACLFSQSLSAQDKILDTQQITGIRILNTNAITGIEKPSVSIKIKQVRTISGNNPLDRREPLLNFNGQRVSSVSELVSLVNGSSSGTSTSSGSVTACQTTATMTTLGANLFAANMDIDGASLSCNTPPPGTTGAGNYSFVVDRTFNAGNVEVTLTLPPWAFLAGGSPQNFAIGAPASFNAVSNSGRQIQINFTVTDPGGAGSPSITISSINVIN